MNWGEFMKSQKRMNSYTYFLLAMMLSFSVCVLFYNVEAHAKEKTNTVAGMEYEFNKKNDFEISSANKSNKINSGTQYGTFSICGNVKAISSVNGYPSYQISQDNVDFSYNLCEEIKKAKATEWHIDECKSKKVDKLKLEDDIKSGAVIIQTSLDGEKWITDEIYTDINSKGFKSDFYETNNIQQVNGCYYRITVVYQLEKQEKDTKIAFVKKHNYSYKRCAEVYQFYLINENVSQFVSDLSNKYNIGTTIKVKKDSGYSEKSKEEIDIKDVHYGWDLGSFYLSGYTEKQGKDDNPVFLKKYGDIVTLWFNLKQDINKLNGNNKLSICEDKDGYDQYFGTKKTNFKHGTLIIKYTNCENEKKDPIIYTDYLAACATTGADTKVELFEEGDYEVALDYKIKNDGLTNSYSDYRISFKFSIRNGNCMFFPFDMGTGSELKDGALTESGFRLDLAKSRFLNMNVKQFEIVDNNGVYCEDVRSNAVASDGDTFVKEGKYIITASSEYSSIPTEKTIYVGESAIIKAMASSGYTLEKINELLANGYVLNDDGSLEKDEIEVEVTTEETKEEVKEEITTETTENEIVPVSTEPVCIEDDKNNESGNVIPIILLVVFLVVVGVVAFVVYSKKKKGE